MTLLDYFNSLGPDQPIEMENVAKCVKKLAKAFQRLHYKGIIHRNVCLENISANPAIARNERKASEENKGATVVRGYKMQITGFDLAFCLKKDFFEVK